MASLPVASYVDDQRCADCHQVVAEHYAQHPMGRSLELVGEAKPVADEDLGVGQGKSFVADRFRYTVKRDAGGVQHVQARLDDLGAECLRIEKSIAFAVGSGRRGRSYLIMEDDFLFQSPITWYGQRQRWDLSPGFEGNNSQFHRPVTPECLFCHANHVRSVESAVNRYQLPVFSRGCAIGCQRCHGPGAGHVAAAQMGEAGEIVHPARLDAVLQDAICQQCHLSGAVRVERQGKRRDDYRPGQRLDAFVRTFVWQRSGARPNRFVGHFEQMIASPCYTESDGALRCTTCHDPHVFPDDAERHATYRAACLKCHQKSDCGTDQVARNTTNPVDDCIRCHMPRQASEIRHAATTNHLIPRQVESLPESSSRNPQQLVPFIEVPDEPTEQEALQRDRAIAMAQLLSDGERRVTSEMETHAYSTLQRHVERHQQDVDAWQALSHLAMRRQDASAAHDALMHVLRTRSNDEQALSNLAKLYSATNRPRLAIQAWRRARQANPYSVSYSYELALLLYQADQPTACLAEALEGRRRFPDSMGLRHMVVAAYLQLGQHEQAAEEMRQIERYHPPQWDRLKDWYDRQPGAER